ncbi:MAG: 50S ribosomal protein L13 [Patescibacteria group bacterium]
MKNSDNQNKEGKTANLVEPKAQLGSTDERREGSHGLSSRVLHQATAHMPSHKLPERWFLVDAKDKVLGRLAVKIAELLMGKDNAMFNQAVQARTNVVVINAKYVKLTGNKLTGKIYTSHSGYPGGITTKTPADILAGNKPNEVLRHAVAGMLPKNKLHNLTLDRLKIYAEDEHRHGGQNPIPVKL